MFESFGFTRTKREAAAVKPQAKPRQESSKAESDAMHDASLANLTVIADIASLGGIRYVSLSKLGLEQLRLHVACVNHQEKGVLLLVSKDIWGRAAHYDIKQRAKRTAVPVTLLPAEKEVVQALHESSGVDAQGDSGQSKEEESSVEKLVDAIFNQACEMSVSDVHIECRSTHAEVFFRVFGQRILKRSISREAALGIAGLLFDVRADHGAKTSVKWSPDEPIDGVIDHKDASGRSVQVRFASAPIYPRGCFQLVCRLLKMDPRSAPSFNLLGYTPQQTDHVEEMIIGAQGLVLLVGPTNSGKSTTMQALARRIFEVRGSTIKIESIEDPVEYIIPGATQMPVGTRADFASLLKSTLRHDPDVLLVGEVRDTESADSIKNIVLAGRKVLATLHAYDAMAAWARLVNIGVPPDVLYMSGFVSGIVYQRLLPKLCPHCATPYEGSRDSLPDALVQRIERVLVMGSCDLKIHNPKGCPHCVGGAPGYKGRSVCAEYVVPDHAMLEALREGRHQAAKTQWMRSASDTGFGPTALAHALKIMGEGLADPRDVESQIGIIRAPQMDPGFTSESSSKVRELPLMGRGFVGSGGLPDVNGSMEYLYERHMA